MIPANSSAVSEPRVTPGKSVKRLLPWLVAVAFFMESLDTTILNTAVPAIAKALAVAPLSMKAVLSSYTLSLAVFIPISGWMADRFGTRPVFASAIGLLGLYLVYRHLPDYREEHSHPLDTIGLILFGCGIALLSYVLEVFGEHTLSGRAMLGLLVISAASLTGYGLRAARTEFPLLRL